VVRSTGHPLAHWQARREGGIGHAVALRPLVLLPDRDWLYARCDRALPDVGRRRPGRSGGAAGPPARPDLPVMRAIGVPEIAAFLAGTRRRLRHSAGQQATRRYAKRQFTWLRHQFPAIGPGTHENYLDRDRLASLFQI
jgi:tRNA dimethylallyltransferase